MAWNKKGHRNSHIGSVAKECDVVGIDGSSVHFFSVKSAKRALAGLISMLPKRKSKDEPKKYVIEK